MKKLEDTTDLVDDCVADHDDSESEEEEKPILKKVKKEKKDVSSLSTSAHIRSSR
jgi:hypothetical protein